MQQFPVSTNTKHISELGTIIGVLEQELSDLKEDFELLKVRLLFDKEQFAHLYKRQAFLLAVLKRSRKHGNGRLRKKAGLTRG